MQLDEPLPELFTRSKAIVLDFSKIPVNTPIDYNIQLYFEKLAKQGLNPRLPQNRQNINNQILSKTDSRYLIGKYGEDRVALLNGTPAGDEGRTIHMAIDIFSTELEPVSAPIDGEVVVSGYEEGFGGYGHYLIFKPTKLDFFIFFGHLSTNLIKTGPVKKGQCIANLGDYKDNENGGWSRHLHLQILKELPAKGKTPIGYSSKADYENNSLLFPNPIKYFSDWVID